MNGSNSETIRVARIRPFDIAALAVGLAICRGTAKSASGDRAKTAHPRELIEDAYGLLLEAENVLMRREGEYMESKAHEDQINVARPQDAE